MCVDDDVIAFLHCEIYVFIHFVNGEYPCKSKNPGIFQVIIRYTKIVTNTT